MASEHFGDGFSSVWASRLDLSLQRAGSNKTGVRVTSSNECYSFVPWNSRISKRLIYLPHTRKRRVTAVCLCLTLCWCTHLVYPHHPQSHHVQFPGQWCTAQHAGKLGAGKTRSQSWSGVGKSHVCRPFASGSLASLFGDSDSEQQQVLVQRNDGGPTGMPPQGLGVFAVCR